MARIAPRRGLLTAFAGLGLLGTFALGGLVSPLAGDYLQAGSANGDAAISGTTLLPSLARVHFAPLARQRLTVMRDGEPQTLLLEFDPDCPPPSGWV